MPDPKPGSPVPHNESTRVAEALRRIEEAKPKSLQAWTCPGWASLPALRFELVGDSVQTMDTPDRTDHAGRQMRWILGLIAIFLLNPPNTLVRAEDGAAPSSASRFIRFVQTSGEEGHVDTAITTYARADGVSVALMSAVHIADGEYYRKLQRRFKEFDSVLYEMVKPREMPATRELQSNSPVSMLQVGAKNLLGLEFQLDAIDYSPTNFVHADMDTTTFLRTQEASGETILGLMIRAILAEQNRQAASSDPYDGLQMLFALMSKDRAYKLKYLFAQQMESLESILQGIDQGPDGKGSVLVSGRNQAALSVLTEQIGKGKRKLAIFYGAGHMPNFEKCLTETGFKKSKEEWVTAWDIRKPKATAEKP